MVFKLIPGVRQEKVIFLMIFYSLPVFLLPGLKRQLPFHCSAAPALNIIITSGRPARPGSSHTCLCLGSSGLGQGRLVSVVRLSLAGSLRPGERPQRALNPVVTDRKLSHWGSSMGCKEILCVVPPGSLGRQTAPLR